MGGDEKNLRKLVKKGLKDAVALMAFFGATRDQLEKRQWQVQRVLDTNSRTSLTALLKQIRQINNKIRTEYEVTVPTSRILEVIENARKGAPGKSLFLSKEWIEKACGRYDRLMPDFSKLPAHALVVIEPWGREQAGIVEIVVLEAILYEDMCALFNLQNDYRGLVPHPTKRGLKTQHALARATINAALYFVEAYANGLASEAISRRGDELDDDQMGLLHEWDFKRDRRRSLTLRDKLLQYPRLILGAEHPPLTESNCEELAFILEHAKQHRDAVAHASPVPGISEVNAKEELIFNPVDADVDRTVDAAVALVRRMEGIVSPERALRWLVSRDESGRFPENAFD